MLHPSLFGVKESEKPSSVFAVANPEGGLAFYTPDLHTNIPKGAVPISHEVWQFALRYPKRVSLKDGMIHVLND